jgi:hypothetical protein
VRLARVAGVLAAWALLPTAVGAAQQTSQPLSPDEKAFGLTLGEWAAAYIQWSQSIPKSVDPAADKTGVGAGIGQHLPVWFLPGVAPGSNSSRTMIVPAGASLLIPGPFEGLFDSPGDRTEESLRAQLQDNASYLAGVNWEMTVDGTPLPDLQRYRVQTGVFSIVLPPGNFPGIPVTAGKDQRLISLEDGYFLLLPPLPVGKHVLVQTFPGGGWTFTLLIQNPNEPLP